jgi:hypothetical protein
MTFLTKSLAAGAAALALGLAFAPAAEARHRPHGWHGHHGGHHWGHHCSWRFPHRCRGHWGPAIGVGFYGGSCYIVRQRVWSDDLGRFIRVRRTVCD